LYFYTAMKYQNAQHYRGTVLLDTLITYFAEFPTMTIILSTYHHEATVPNGAIARWAKAYLVQHGIPEQQIVVPEPSIPYTTIEAVNWHDILQLAMR